MHDSTLLIISLTMSLAGIILLWIISYNTSLDNDLEVGAHVKIHGKILSLREAENTYLLRVGDKGKEHEVVVFKDGIARFEKDQQVEVTGKVREFNGRLQILAERIKG